MRPLYYVLCACVIAVVLGVGLYYFSPASLQTAFSNSLENSSALAVGSVPITVLGKGTNALSITDRVNYRITNTADLQSLWLLVYGQDDMHPVPTIDFTKYEVLAVFDGTHATNGFSIAVTTITDQAPLRMVTIEHDTPGTGCTTSAPQTSPFELIEVPASTLSISHKDVSVALPCAQ